MKPNRIVLSFFVVAIVLTVSALSMSVAWYSSSDFVQLTGIEIYIDPDRDISVSTERDGVYQETLDASQLVTVNEFRPRTSAYASEWLDNHENQPKFYDETTYSTFEVDSLKRVADRGYFSQRLFLRSDDDLYLSISGEKTYIKANESYNEAYANKLYREYQEGKDESLKALTKEEIKQRLDKLVNAMRFSILFVDEDIYGYYIIDPHKDGDVYYGGLLDNDVDRFYDSYVKDADGQWYERVYGELEGDRSLIAYDEPLADDSDYEDTTTDPSAFNARHKKGVKRFNLEKSLEQGLQIKKEPSIDLNDFNGTKKPFQFPIYRNQPREIVLSLYIEGWDLDSVNYTMGATFVSNLSFMIVREM